MKAWSARVSAASEMTPDATTVAIVAVLSVLLVLILYVWVSLALAAVFRKMGEPGWKGWVPFLNIATLFQWAGFSPWLTALVLVPVLGWGAVLIILIISLGRLNVGFGYGTSMTVLGAVLFIAWASIVGFGPARWRGSRRPPTSEGPRVGGGTAEVADVPHVGPVATPEVTQLDAWAPPAVDWNAPDSATEPDPQITGAEPFSPTPATRPLASVNPPSASHAPWIPGTSIQWEGEIYPEVADEVSAVVDSPIAGSPRSALTSVSAQQDLPTAEVPVTPIVAGENTTLVRRRHADWILRIGGGAPLPLHGEVIILGRNPAVDTLYPRAQLIAVPDPTRTVSKTHARVVLIGGVWEVTDLNSTNGVTLVTADGSDELLEPGATGEVYARFLLGDAEITIERAPQRRR